MNLHEQTVLWVVGEPGVGKSSLVRGLMEPGMTTVPKPKWTVGSEVVAVGHYTGANFDGGDTVPYNGAEECLAYWQANLRDKRLTLFDGDRFSNATAVAFFRALAAPPRMVCAYLSAPAEVVLARRRARSTEVQNEQWVRGRATKARNFSEGFLDVVALDATRPTEQLLEELRAHLAAPYAAPDESGSLLSMFS